MRDDLPLERGADDVAENRVAADQDNQDSERERHASGDRLKQTQPFTHDDDKVHRAEHDAEQRENGTREFR